MRTDIEELEAELATPKGFAARVEPPAGLRDVGGTICIMGVVAAPGLLFPGHRVDALDAIALCLALGLSVVGVGVVRMRLGIRPIRRKYQAGGWVSAQAPTGLVYDSSDEGNGVVRRDEGLMSGRREHSTPVVLVGGRGASRASIEAAAAASRDAVVGLTDREARELSHRVRWEAIYRASDAALILPVPAGMYLTRQVGKSPYVLVTPATDGRRCGRPRFYGIKVGRARRAPRAAEQH